MRPHTGKAARAALLALLLATLAAQAPAQAVSANSATAIRGTAIDAGPGAPSPAAKAAAPTFIMAGGRQYRNVDFQLLASYPFNTPNEKATNDTAIAEVEKQIPAAIKALEGKRVTVRGFLVPVKDTQGRSTEFLIVRDQPNCCYSGMTTITEFVSIKVPAPGVETIMDQPVTVRGTLHVGAIVEGGYVLGVYKMDGENLVDPPKE